MGIVIGNLFIITYTSSFPTILQAMYMYAVKYSNAFDYEFSFPLNKQRVRKREGKLGSFSKGPTLIRKNLQ